MISVYLGTGVSVGLDRGIIKGHEKTWECVHVCYLDCVSMFVILIVQMAFKGVCDVCGIMGVYICQDLTKCIVYGMSI